MPVAVREQSGDSTSKRHFEVLYKATHVAVRRARAGEFEIAEDAALLRLEVTPPPPNVMDADGWSALVRLTLVVADGPADTGYLVQRVGRDLVDPAPEGWEEAARRHGEITVAFGTGQDAPRRKVALAGD